MRAGTNLPGHSGRVGADRRDVLKTYKDEWIVEERTVPTKQTLKVRPIFLDNDDRIAPSSPSSASRC